MAETKNIMIVGVGGQGTLLTSRILGGITVEAGYDVILGICISSMKLKITFIFLVFLCLLKIETIHNNPMTNF